MESKKINQLATELAPDLSDLTIIGDPTTGISKKITLSQMASLFTGTVEEYANLAAFPLVGVADTIYIALDTNVLYRYDTSLSAYVILSPNIINSLVFSDANGFDGTITLVGSVATLSITTALTLGSVPFIGASGALTQDNSNLFFDDTNNRLGIATASPTTPLDVFGSGIIGRLNATSTNNAYLGFASNGTNKWSAGNVQSDHRFRIFSEANSAELITILQTGEFGIGIANPLTKFHIDGGATALIANLDANVSVAKSVSFRSDNSSRINLEVSGTESGSNAGADFFLRTFTDAGSLLETPFQIVRSTGLTTVKNIAITGLTSGYLPKANGSSALSNSLIWDNGTNVGIGNTNTSYKFDVSGNGRFNIDGLSAVFGTSTTTQDNYVSFVGQGSNFDMGVRSTANGNVFGIAESGIAYRFVIAKTTGNVGIGTSSPAAKFELAGSSGNFQIASSGAEVFFTRNDNNDFLANSGSSAGIRFGAQQQLRFATGTSLTTRMTISVDGDIGIGTSGSAGNRLFVKGSTTTSGNTTFITQNSAGTTIFYVRDDGWLISPTTYNNTSGVSANVGIDSAGNIFRATSSIKYKKDIKPYDKGLDTILLMNPIYYKSISDFDGNKQFAGFIAEEIHELGLNEFVQYNDENNEPEGLNYGNITAILVKAIQELKAEIEELKAKIK